MITSNADLQMLQFVGISNLALPFKKACVLQAFFLCCLLSGCAVFEGKDHFNQAMSENGFESHTWLTPHYQIKGFIKHHDSQAKIGHVYIEGDGYAYTRKNLPTDDPTIQNPEFGRYAAKAPYAFVVYLARPCQWTRAFDPKCQKEAWTLNRFSRDVIDSFDVVLNELKQQYHLKAFIVSGYSGGGVIANELAMKRDDIVKLITISSPLDVNAWTEHHHISPLKQAYSPFQHREKLQMISQIHLVGEKDWVVPPQLEADYLQKMHLEKSCLKIIQGADHASILRHISAYFSEF